MTELLDGEGEAHGCATVGPGLDGRWMFRLYIAGKSTKSMVALDNLRRLCDEHLRDNYELELVDLVVQPELAQRDQILAVPTLVRHLPQPVKRIVGDLSDYQRTLMNLGLIRNR